MNWEDEEQAIRKFFWDAYSPLYPDVPVAWPGVAFDPSKQAVDAQGMPKPWLSFDLLDGDGVRKTLGTKEYRFVGIIQVKVYYPKGGGVQELNALASAISTMLIEKRMSHGQSGYIKTGVPSKHGPMSSGAWEFVVVSTPFKRDVVRA